MAEERVALSLVEKVNKLDAIKSDSRQYSAAVKLIKELVNAFNNYELMKLVSFPRERSKEKVLISNCSIVLQDSLDGQDYSAHLMLHLIDGNDLVNAKFLYQRVPDFLKKRSQSFIKLWTAVKALHNNQFGTALSLLREPLPSEAPQSTNPIKNVLETLRKILVWHLSEHTVPDLIASAYSNIEMARVRELLGSPNNLDQLLASTHLLASTNADAQGFVEVNQRAASTETFALD